MAYVKGQPFYPQFTDPATGLLMTSGTVEFYLTGSSTPTPYYTDSIGTSGGTSLTLNSSGKPATDVYYDTSITYKILVKNAAGTTLETIDPFVAFDTTFSARVKTYGDLATATAAVNAGDIEVGNKIETLGYYGGWAATAAGVPFGGNHYELVDSGSSGARPAEDSGSVIHCTGGSGGLYLKGLFKDDEINIMQFGAYKDRTNATTTTLAVNDAIAYALSIASGGGKKPTIKAPSGRFLLEETGSTGQAVLIDKNANSNCWGLVIEGASRWDTAFHMYDDAVTCFRGTESTSLVDVRSFLTLRDFSIFGSSSLAETGITNKGIDFRQCPNATLDNLYIDNFGTGVQMQNSFNSTVQGVLVFNCPVLPWDIKTNSNDICFLNCVGEGIPGFATYSFKAESSHGISIKGGGYENADYAFNFEACEYTLDTYTEACTEGVLKQGTASPNTYGNVLNLYSYNNGENTSATGEGLFNIEGGTLIVNQLRDTTARDVAAKVFNCSGGGKAVYGFLHCDSKTALGSFDAVSAGSIRPMFEAPIVENISTVNTSNAASTEYIGRASRPWKVQRVEVYRLSGDISGCNIQIGNTIDPDSLANYTLLNQEFQILEFAATNTVEVATTANITLSGEQTIDGELTLTDRILVKDQTDATENGVYVTASGAWTRATDADASNEILLYSASVNSGTTNAGKEFTNTNSSLPDIGTDNITFAETNGGMFQTTGSYTNQTGYFILTNDGGGSSGTFQVVFRYYLGYSGVTSIPGSINDVDKFIDSNNASPAPVSLQFID